ncbi:sigma-70 family RNA polymerase sigma factor [Luteolibacter marinus]|uniref:sigma-70 family RNA polymerase sigma factor n=1 Tax=Luteolibacter marinus TaxID=2776705 RepID=UPI00186784B5|nr:sigma-70 family RNA polymerase sigma factor [Luteolibacter marinus]
MPEPSSRPDAFADFVSLLTMHQADLWAFLISLMPGHPDVGDVLQQTNIVLWKKQSQFRPGSDFRAWAFKVARYEMLHHLRSRRRDDWVPMNEQLADTIAQEMPDRLAARQPRLAALEGCLAKLRPQDRKLLEHRYQKGNNLESFSRASGRSVSALSVTLFRLRTALRKCVANQLQPNEGTP